MTGALDFLRVDVEEIINDLGAPGTWQEITRTNILGQGTTTAVQTNHAVIVTPPSAIDSRLVNGTTILATDLLVMLAAKSITFIPKQGDRLLLPDDHSVMQTYEVAPDGVQDIRTGIRSGAYLVRMQKLGAE